MTKEKYELLSYSQVKESFAEAMTLELASED